MFFQIQKTTPQILQTAQNYFPRSYWQNLSKESLLARFLIAQKVIEQFKIKNFYPQFKSNGAVKFDLQKKIYFSLSHKNDFVAIAVSRQEIGIDLEILKNRHKSLWNNFKTKEWEILKQKDWLNFYFLWTAKEALIKKLQLNLNALKQIFLQNKNKNILNLQFEKKIFPVKIFQKENLIYAIAE